MPPAAPPAAPRGETYAAATVLGQQRWTDTLLSLRVKAAIEPFEPGQFAKLALAVDGERVARAYSFVNAPGGDEHEFYYSIVAGGPLSPRLARLVPGDQVEVTTRGNGYLVLSEVPDAGTLWMLATGTGIGPFLSMLAAPEVWRRFPRVVLVHAVRHGQDLSYAARIASVAAGRGEAFRFVPMLSRDDGSPEGALRGRIPAAILDGRLAAASGMPLDAASSHVMLCGNPAMVADATEALKSMGMRRHRRRAPGHITAENYW